MSHLARVALLPLSILNAGAGLTLAIVALTTSAVPIWVCAPAGAVAVQGMYTLAWLADRVPLGRRAADVVFATGEAAALVLGAAGVIAAIIQQSTATDPEYGPPTMMSLVAVHALVGLLASPRQPDDTAIAVS